MFQRRKIRPETTFVDDLGADSLDVFQIIMGIEEEFDIEIDNEEAEDSKIRTGCGRSRSEKLYNNEWIECEPEKPLEGFLI